MAFYRTCPDCGASLDPGEKCDCQEEKKQDFFDRHLKMDPRARQLAFVLDDGEGCRESKSCC